MKKALSLLLALVLCLSLCACGSKNMYVGTYESGGHMDVCDGSEVDVAEEMVLNRDGTGTLTRRSLSSDSSFLYGKYSLNEGDVLISYELEWEVSDGYLIITGSGLRYYEMPGTSIVDMIPTGEPVEFSQSYELKGNKLFAVGRDYASYTKVN